jgi:hypothetical protein
MFIVMSIKKSINVSVLGLEREVDLIYADGMIGALSVFDTRESAEAWASDGTDVIEVKHKEI